MPPSESSIEAAIEKLKGSPAKFQRLIEHYARLTYSHRFTNLIPQGRNQKDVAVKGWPDIYSLLPDGRMDVAEATHSTDWPRHLEEDLRKAESLGKGRFAGFLFVAWDNEPTVLTDHRRINSRHEYLMQCRDRLTQLDIPPENINFVFKKQLVSALTQPRFAAVLSQILELPSSSFPFKCTSKERRLFGITGRIDVFAPAKEEYKNNLVHPPAITAKVEGHLDRENWALVLGRGATGKTVLAIQIALRYESESYPTYYLDLARTDVNLAEALNVIITHADYRVLFIVDNVHLNEEVAREMFDQWKTASMGSRLLLLGRDVSFTDSKGAARPLEDLKLQALTLRVEQDDIAGVYRRLMHRFHNALSPPEPPPKILQDWHVLFGGDLIAFSAAVARRTAQLRYKNWELQPQDAADYVQEHYLEKYEGAQPSLLTMAALAQLEVDAPQEAIDLAKVRPLLREGLVHRSKYGRYGQFEYYQLVHAGVGALLLRAAGYSADKSNEFTFQQIVNVARLKPFSGTLIATRLDTAGRQQEAALVYKSIIESSPEGVITLFRTEMQALRFIFDRVVRFGLLSETEIDHLLAGNPSFLNKVILQSGFDNITFFLNFSKENLPQLYSALTSILKEKDTVEALARKACTVPLDSLIGFLRTTSTGPLVVSAINEEEWNAARLNRTFGEPRFLPKLARMLKGLGRIRLAETAARAIINAANPKDWQGRHTDFYHLGYVMRLGRAAEPEDVQRFLHTIVNSNWLQTKYIYNSTAEIASSLFNLWRYYDQSVLTHFCIGELSSRVTQELRYLRLLKPRQISGVLQLLGSSTLIGLNMDKSEVQWPADSQIHALLGAATRYDLATIKDFQITLGLGLRKMAQVRDDYVHVPPESGSRLLGIWKISPAYSPKQKSLNAWMIKWLEQCAQAGWILVHDDTPFADITTANPALSTPLMRRT